MADDDTVTLSRAEMERWYRDHLRYCEQRARKVGKEVAGTYVTTCYCLGILTGLGIAVILETISVWLF